MKFKLNLDNFQNIEFKISEELTKEEQYLVLAEWLEGWLDYTPFAVPIANQVRKILGLEPLAKVDKSVSGDGTGQTNRPNTRQAESHIAESQALPVVREVNAITEEVLMNLNDVTVMVLTEKAVLVSKRGYQKWVPLSTIESGVPLKEGVFLQEIELTAKGEKWIHKKAWEPLEVRKR